ncbi:MAG: hypothetical protein H8E98_01570 [Bacteroidetes bacterium]|nr:hypothetical protein [Bacteroidota bacterium]
MMRKNKYGLTHNMTGTVEHKAWDSMKQRCTNPNNHNYGKRGITIDPRWLGEDGFQNFYEDMGSKPGPEYSIERVDNNKGYNPVNCKWATIKDQNRNTRANAIKNIQEAENIRELYKSGKYTLTTLANTYNCSRQTISNIVNNVSWTN